MFAALLLLFAAQSTLLTNDIYVVPAREWRYVEFGTGAQPIIVSCDFESKGSADVRVELLTKEDFEAMRKRNSYGVVAQTENGVRGSLRQPMRNGGEFILLLVNDNLKSAAQVKLHLSLDFSNRTSQVRYLSPERRLSVIVISFLGFLAIVTLSARKLLMSIR